LSLCVSVCVLRIVTQNKILLMLSNGLTNCCNKRLGQPAAQAHWIEDHATKQEVDIGN
jgi:hypothetical protein